MESEQKREMVHCYRMYNKGQMKMLRLDILLHVELSLSELQKVDVNVLIGVRQLR